MPRPRPLLSAALTALAVPLLSLLGWSLVAGGPCGSSDAKAEWVLAAWFLPALLAAALGRFALKAPPLALLGGVVAGLGLAFLLFLGVVFPVCG